VGSVTSPRRVERPRWEGPDPAFVSLKWGPLAPAPGGAGTMEFDVVNHGEPPAGPFRIAVHASLGRVVTANRTLLGAAEVASIGSSGQHRVVPFTAPTAPGAGRRPRQHHERFRAAHREVTGSGRCGPAHRTPQRFRASLSFVRAATKSG
jgi:hypothetical protein